MEELKIIRVKNSIVSTKFSGKMKLITSKKAQAG